MPATSTDQVAWLSCNVTVGGEQKRFARDALLPPAASQAETAERNILRLGGALRPVEVWYEAGEAGAPEVKAAQAAAPAKQAEPAVVKAPEPPPAPAKAAAAPVIVGAEDDTAPPARPPMPPRPVTSKKP